ncbi:type II secretion system F family protein [candidate division CSSED10-310 bacterium]|uniref:Type II secretion system F family protein n=1 Tax=candidate division CSSED10-310 bacterium TaxID=2855610 RepID=A0ABV6Z6P2_UNCC1
MDGFMLSVLIIVFICVGGIVHLVFSSFEDSSGRLFGDYGQWMVETLEKQFITITVEKCKLSIVSSVIVFGVLGFLFSRTLIIAIPMAVLGWYFPKIWVLRMEKKRQERFEEQLVDALVLLSNALRSGLSLLQGIRIVVREMGPPISQEFNLVLREQKFSALLDDALTNMSKRMRSDDLDIVVTSILTLRETGGNLPETFDKVTETIRERKKVEGKIVSLTTMGYTQGMVACFLPFAFVFLMSVVHPQMIDPLLHTWLGRVFLILAVILDGIGFIFIRKTVQIEV